MAVIVTGTCKQLFKDAEAVTAASHHPCHNPKPIEPRTLEAVLFPPINQWGQTRQADTGLAHHKSLPVDDLAADPTIDLSLNTPAPAAAAPVWDWAAANHGRSTPYSNSRL